MAGSGRAWHGGSEGGQGGARAEESGQRGNRALLDSACRAELLTRAKLPANKISVIDNWHTASFAIWCSQRMDEVGGVNGGRTSHLASAWFFFLSFFCAF